MLHSNCFYNSDFKLLLLELNSNHDVWQFHYHVFVNKSMLGHLNFQALFILVMEHLS